MHEVADRAVDVTGLTAVRAAAAARRCDLVPRRRPTPTPASSIASAATAADRPHPALAARLAAAPNWRARFDAMDDFLAARRSAAREPAPQVVRAHDLLRRSGGSMPIAALAESVGWDPRRLQRAFPTQIGVRPKAAARIVRLQRALRLLGSGLPPARVANECSYFDQAHLTNDITELTGRSPRRLLAERAAMPPGP